MQSPFSTTYTDFAATLIAMGGIQIAEYPCHRYLLRGGDGKPASRFAFNFEALTESGVDCRSLEQEYFLCKGVEALNAELKQIRELLEKTDSEIGTPTEGGGSTLADLRVHFANLEILIDLAAVNVARNTFENHTLLMRTYVRNPEAIAKMPTSHFVPTGNGGGYTLPVDATPEQAEALLNPKI